MAENFIRSNHVQICTESFGETVHAAVLLIMGESASMVWWPDEFCRLLASKQRFVIRYDQRDTGCSTCYTPGKPEYSLEDLADDAVAVLDSYGIASADIVGMSMGGRVGQIVALKYPHRVAALTLVATCGLGAAVSHPTEAHEKLIAYHRQGFALDWSDKKALVDYSVGGWRLLSGEGHAFDEELVREIATREVERSKNLPSMFNHGLLPDGFPWAGKSWQIEVPTLVVHGTDDPVYSCGAGVALCREIPNAKLLKLAGSGHELHREDWDEIVGVMMMQSVVLSQPAP
ncbi:MAG TPA: alpha/beta hydrolase [Candidatus Koribacter sp.]